MNFLNDLEKSAVERFISDPLMSEAVKKVILYDIYNAGTLVEGKPAESKKNWVFGLIMDEFGKDYKQTNEEIGARVKACVEGIRTVELAFKEMEKLKNKPAVEIPINPGR